MLARLVIPFVLFGCGFHLCANGQSAQEMSLDSLIKSCHNKSLHDTLRAESYVIVSSRYTSIQMDTVETICLEGISFINSVTTPNEPAVAKELIRSESVLYTNAGYAKYHLGDFDQALKYWYISLNKKELLNDQKGIASVLNNIANLEADLGELDKAEVNFNKALEIQIKLNDSAAISKTYINLGYVKRIQDHDSLALENYQKALSIKLKINDRQGIANCYNNIGFIHKKNKEYQQAIDYYNQSYQINKEINSIYGLLASLNNLANCYYEIAQINKAHSFAIKGYKLAKEHEMFTDLRYLTEILYKIYKTKKDYKSALNAYEEFVSIKDSLYSQEHYKTLIDQELKHEYEKKEQRNQLSRMKEKELDDLRHENEMKISEERSAKLQSLAIVISVGLLLVFVLLFLINYQLKITRKQKQIIEKQNLEIEMKALRAQMNPHFIFNSLNSIKNFILKNEAEIAAGYLTKFSKLMRLVLENSEENLITLEKELEGLQYYLELEQLRFNGHFKYDIKSYTGTDFIRIPPLILQPFVENAIWHGLLHRNDESGFINITIEEMNSKVNITISDNGVGRKKAAEFKSSSPAKKKSMGLSITQDRLKVLKDVTGVEVTVDVNDILNENAEVCGTKVVLGIPSDG